MASGIGISTTAERLRRRRSSIGCSRCRSGRRSATLPPKRTSRDCGANEVSMRLGTVAFLVATVALGAAGTVHAQMSRGDSAAVVLETARALERDGRVDAAREVLRLLARRYAGTP